MQNFNFLASVCSWAGWIESYLVANPKDRVSRVTLNLLVHMFPSNQFYYQYGFIMWILTS